MERAFLLYRLSVVDQMPPSPVRDSLEKSIHSRLAAFDREVPVTQEQLSNQIFRG